MEALRTEVRELHAALEGQVAKVVSAKVNASAAEQALKSRLSIRVMQQQMQLDKEELQSALEKKAAESLEAAKSLTATAQQSILKETSNQMTVL